VSGGLCYNIGEDLHLHKWVDAKSMFAILESVMTAARLEEQELHVYIEKVSASPIMGQASAFKFGYNYGQWQAIFDCLGLDYILVAPQSWQMYLNKPADLRGAPLKKWLKTQAITHFADTRGVKEKDITLSVCDAMLIWEFGRRQ